MNIQNAKWELEILLDSKLSLKIQGRDFDYNDENRIRDLRAFIDADATPPTTEPDHGSVDESSPKQNKSEEIPF